MNKSLLPLMKLCEDYQTLIGIEYLLHWDSDTYMPAAGITTRSKHKEYISREQHRLLVGDSFSEALKKLIDPKTKKFHDPSLTFEEKTAILRALDDYEKESKLPQKLVEEIAKTTTESSHVWADCKKNDDFATFLPYLKKVFHLMQQKADCLGYKDHPYDALVDLYEPGMTIAQIDPLFNQIKKPIQQILNARSHPHTPHKGHYDINKQKELSLTLLNKMGFTKDTYRLDLSSHPFCLGLGPHDIRMTTRIGTDDLHSNLLTVLHEGGHGLYEDHAGHPSLPYNLSRYLSIGFHESQSKFWECFVGLSLPFWEGLHPSIKHHFPDSHLTAAEIYKEVTHVEPTLIRVESDEVTYPLHIILRYEIEKGLIDGTYKAEDLPDIWNTKMREYLGITPPNNRLGCLQDVHWSAGYVGYFPTYALGCIYAAQFFDKFKKDHPDYEALMRKGDFSFIKDWLVTHIHRYGRLYHSSELIAKATGTPLTSKFFTDHLLKKYQTS